MAHGEDVTAWTGAMVFDGPAVIAQCQRDCSSTQPVFLMALRVELGIVLVEIWLGSCWVSTGPQPMGLRSITLQ